MANLVSKGRIEYANDPITAGLITSDTETRAAIRGEISPLVGEALADPDVSGVVTDAVDIALDAEIIEKNLVRGNDSRLPLIREFAGVLIALTDQVGNRTFLETNDVDGGPTVQSANLLAKQFLRWAVTEYPGVLFALTDQVGNRTFVEVSDVDGAPTPQAAGLIGKSLGVAVGKNPGEYVAYGDSMTALQAGTGLLYPEVLSSLLGKPVVNKGVSGETSFEIAYRQGGLQYLLNITGGVLPATTASTPVTIANPPAGGWSSDTQPSRVSSGTIYGIPCTLTYNTVAGTWSIARVTSGTAVSVPQRVPFIRTEEYTSSTQIIWAGRNDPQPNKATTPQINVDLMVKNLAGASKRFLVVSVLNRTNGGEGTGTVNYNDIVASNLALQNMYPRNFVDLRKHLILNGLAEAGITATTQDLADIARDEVPTSLMFDGLHLNEAGRFVTGQFIYRNLVWRGLA